VRLSINCKDSTIKAIMVFTTVSASKTVASIKKNGCKLGRLNRRTKKNSTSNKNTSTTTSRLDAVSSSSPDTPAVTKTLFHVPTRTTDTSKSDNSSDDDSCCHFDAGAGQSKMVLESKLIGEKVPIEEVVKCIHNLLAIACKDPEMRNQVLLCLLPENAVEASNFVPAPPIVVDGTPMVNYDPHAFAISK
jgi:hypothetical protein